MNKIHQQDTQNVATLIEHLSQLDSKQQHLIPQYIGRFLCLTNFYDATHDAFISQDTVELLQKFAYLFAFTSIDIMKQTHDLIKEWAKDPVVNQDSLYKYHTSCDKIKKALDTDIEEMENKIKIGQNV